MIQVGQRVKFDPFGAVCTYTKGERPEYTTGTVVMVNYLHKWFSVQYENQRTSFKFWEIGRNVFICK